MIIIVFSRKPEGTGCAEEGFAGRETKQLKPKRIKLFLVIGQLMAIVLLINGNGNI